MWGRGAVDMLNLTASMAVAFKGLAKSGFKPKGTLVYLAVADEESLGTWGAEHLVEQERDAVAADYVITESGGFQMPAPSGPKLPVLVGEKGSYWCRITVKGTPGHASQPFRTDNALVTAAEVVRRLADYRPPAQIHNIWRDFINGVEFPAEISEPLLDAGRIDEFCEILPLGLAREAHACTHTTFAPTIIHGGTKTNVIPDEVAIEVDIRTLPGQKGADVHQMIETALGDLVSKVDITPFDDNESTASPSDDAAVGRAPAGQRSAREGLRHRAVPDGGRDRRRASSAGWVPSRTASDCSAGTSRSRITRRCSTATTSGSTSTRSSCRRSSGTRPHASCSGDDRGRRAPHHRHVRLDDAHRAVDRRRSRPRRSGRVRDRGRRACAARRAR